MSVLFKALAKAAKTRETASAAGAPVGQPAILTRSGGGSGRKRLMIVIGALCIGGAAGSYLFFMTGDDSSAPAHIAAPRPRAPVIAAPPQAAPQEVAATAPAAAPTTPAAATAPPEPVPAPPVAMAPQTSAPAPAPAPEVSKPAPPHPGTEARVAQPAKVKQTAPLPTEEDLPTLLDKLRRQKGDGSPVAVARAAGSHDLRDEDGHAAIQVGVSSQSGQEAARSAYDALMHGHYGEALASYDKALVSEPRSAPLLLGKATALQKLGHVEEARKTYNMVLAIDPRNREALTNATILVSAQAPEKALIDLQELRKANPGFSPIEAEIGGRLAAAGDVGAAIESLGRAVMLSPDNGLYRLNLAVLQDRAGASAEAASSYRTALDLLSGSVANLPLPIEQIKSRLAYLERR